MAEIIKCNIKDYVRLSEIWEGSVRATHNFLTEKDILDIKNLLIPTCFPSVEIYAVNENEVLFGFVGISKDRIEMLFIDAPFRGYGYGSKLIDFAKEQGCRFVDVNEQNPDALKFYLQKSFHLVGRDETDDSGRPFPILHLSL